EFNKIIDDIKSNGINITRIGYIWGQIGTFDNGVPENYEIWIEREEGFPEYYINTNQSKVEVVEYDDKLSMRVNCIKFLSSISKNIYNNEIKDKEPELKSLKEYTSTMD